MKASFAKRPNLGLILGLFLGSTFGSYILGLIFRLFPGLILGYSYRLEPNLQPENPL